MKKTLIVLFLTGVFFTLKAQQLSQLDSLHSALAQSVSDSAKFYNNLALGNYFYNTQVYNDSAFFYTRKALGLSKNDTEKRARVLFVQASIHNNIGNYDAAIDNFNEVKDIVNDLGLTSVVSYCYNNLGAVYFSKKDYDRAIENYQKSYEIVKGSNDTRMKATCLMNIGESLYEKNDLIASKKVLENSLALLETISENEISFAHLYYAQTLLALDKVQEAESYANEALIFVKERKDLQSITQVYKLLSEISKKKLEHKNALEYAKQFSIYKDSLSTALALNEVDKLELNLAIKDKQVTINRYEQQEKYKSIIYVLLGIGLVLLGILIAGIFQIRRMKKELLKMQLSLLKTKE